MKNQKGITLIALVVTIVVLLILAGVTANAIFSQDGLIAKAQNSQNKMNEAQQNDLEAINELSNFITNKIHSQTPTVNPIQQTANISIPFGGLENLTVNAGETILDELNRLQEEGEDVIGYVNKWRVEDYDGYITCALFDNERNIVDLSETTIEANQTYSLEEVLLLANSEMLESDNLNSYINICNIQLQTVAPEGPEFPPIIEAIAIIPKVTTLSDLADYSAAMLPSLVQFDITGVATVNKEIRNTCFKLYDKETALNKCQCVCIFEEVTGNSKEILPLTNTTENQKSYYISRYINGDTSATMEQTYSEFSTAF